MAQSFDEIRQQNKLLMMELQNLKLTTAEGQSRRLAIQAQLNANNQELRAFATAFGATMDTMPRIMQIKQKIGNYGKK